MILFFNFLLYYVSSHFIWSTRLPSDENRVRYSIYCRYTVRGVHSRIFLIFLPSLLFYVFLYYVPNYTYIIIREIVELATECEQIIFVFVYSNSILYVM